MIKNEKQYHVTLNKLSGFKNTIDHILKDGSIDPDLKEVQVNAMKAQVEIFEEELFEYSQLKNKRVNSATADDLIHLPDIFIKARIAKGWSQQDLASRLNLKEQQIQRYEAQDYSTASWLRIIRIAQVLDIKFYTIKADLKAGHSHESLSNHDLIDRWQEQLHASKSLFCL